MLQVDGQSENRAVWSIMEFQIWCDFPNGFSVYTHYILNIRLA